MTAAIAHLGSWLAVAAGVIFTPLVLTGLGRLSAPLAAKALILLAWVGIVAALALSIR